MKMTVYSQIKNKLSGERKYIQIGRSRNFAGFNSTTPIKFIDDSDSPPKLTGQPYLKTNFSNGKFQKTLYTPSTLEVIVGKNWDLFEEVYSNDDH